MSNKVVLDNHTYITIPKGTIIQMCNPSWDGDKPATHTYFYVKLSEDLCAEVQGQDSIVTLIEEFIK